MQQEIELHIESLLIEGYSHLDARRLKEAIEWELMQRLGEHGLDNIQTEWAGLPDLTLNVQAAPSISLTTTGAQIAQTLHQGIQTALHQSVEAQHKSHT